MTKQQAAMLKTLAKIAPLRNTMKGRSRFSRPQAHGYRQALDHVERCLRAFNAAKEAEEIRDEWSLV
jgi:hypothetical protein